MNDGLDLDTHDLIVKFKKEEQEDENTIPDAAKDEEIRWRREKEEKE